MPGKGRYPTKRNPREEAIRRRLAARKAAATSPEGSVRNTSNIGSVPEDEMVKRRKKVGY